jgi:hypothetical protein
MTVPLALKYKYANIGAFIMYSFASQYMNRKYMKINEELATCQSDSLYHFLNNYMYSDVCSGETLAHVYSGEAQFR